MATLFLAQVIGWYLIIFGLFVLIKHEELKTLLENILNQRALFFVLALLTVILGLLMVVGHNVWVMCWPVIITIFAWLVLINGLARLFFPQKMTELAKSLVSKPIHLQIAAGIFFILGLFLLFRVYF